MSWLKKLGVSGVFIVAFFAFSIFLFFGSPWREMFRAPFSPEQRKVLSVASGTVTANKREGRVVKLSTPEGLILEVYGPLENNTQPLIDRLYLGDRRDAYFQFQGRATNLALKDFDRDSIYEIIAPTYDSSLVPHLNIFRFNKETQKFEPFEPVEPLRQ